MYVDYHSHTLYSFDGESRTEEMLQAAIQRGVEEICFTDHLDYDIPEYHVPDFIARAEEFSQLRKKFTDIKIKEGVEVGLSDKVCAEMASSTLRDVKLDFVIGSVHTVNGIDAWRDVFYEGKSKEKAYREYLETVARVIKTCPWMNALGHYDFVAKYAPYQDRSVSCKHALDAFDSIFEYLITNGMTMEVNTASWQKSAPWGEDVLRRFKELGGEYVTLGSDTHGAERIGARMHEAEALVKRAGIKYIATFSNKKPELHRIAA